PRSPDSPISRSESACHNTHLKGPQMLSLVLACALIQSPAPEPLPTGMMITPTVAKGSVFRPLNPGLPDLPQFTADHPVSTVVSPDGDTLLVLTSGYNRNNNLEGKAVPAQSNEYVFVYDIRGQLPVNQQVLKV